MQNLEALESSSPEAVIDTLLADHGTAGVCLTCSFQAEDMIVLELLRKRLPKFLSCFWILATTSPPPMNIAINSRKNGR
jgi:hypothetical protein